ncbi:hypothetical protein ACFQ0M_47830 [Kitasatospora aburaviensis]
MTSQPATGPGQEADSIPALPQRTRGARLREGEPQPDGVDYFAARTPTSPAPSNPARAAPTSSTVSDGSRTRNPPSEQPVR